MEKTERKILDMVEQGQITAEEGLRLMNAMGQAPAAEPPEEPTGVGAEPVIESESPAAKEPSRISKEETMRLERLKRWWLLPFSIGLVILLLGATWIYMGYQDAGLGLRFWLSWIPFLLGIVIIVASFRIRKGVWLHLKIRQRPGEKPERIMINLPLPLAMGKWFFSAFADKIVGLQDKAIGDIPSILENLSPDAPFYFHVNDDGGEEVEIYIG